MKVLPIKLPDEMYQDLKLLSQATNISMADFIREEIKKPLKEKTKKIKVQRKKRAKKKAFNPIEFMIKNASSAPDPYPGISDDELLYGKGRKLWKDLL